MGAGGSVGAAVGGGVLVGVEVAGSTEGDGVACTAVGFTLAVGVGSIWPEESLPPQPTVTVAASKKAKQYIARLSSNTALAY